MSRNLHLGAASISFSQPLYIESAASIVSQKEADGPLGDFFDLICKDPMFGCGTWESAESTLQKETATLAMNKAGLDFEDIHLMFAGDLLAQTAATCFGSAGLGIPFYGLYGACSTMGESLSLGSLALTAGSARGSYAPPPVISQVRKKNSVFPWDMVTSGPFLPPGL